MNTRGFKRFKGLAKIQYSEKPVKVHPKKDVDSPADRVMNLIFEKDSLGWPNTSVAVMLSDKTSDEVRQFIQNQLMTAHDSAHLINDPQIVNEYQKLESSFIAQCSRNRFESIEQYEERLQSIIKDKETSDLIHSFHERIKNIDLK